MPSAQQLDLQYLARKAASAFLVEEVPLTSTIQKIAEERSLNDAQIDRVCEMANRQVHAELYSRAPAEDRVIDFPLAEAVGVRQGMKKVAQVVSWAPTTRSAYIPGSDGVGFTMEKVAAVATQEEDVSLGPGDLMVAKDILAAVKTEFTVAERGYQNALRMFKHAAVGALSEGTSVGDLISALRPSSPGNGFLREALRPAVDAAHGQGVLVKAGEVAVHIPNSQHPVVCAFHTLTKAAEAYLVARAVYEQASTVHDEVYRLYAEVSA